MRLSAKLSALEMIKNGTAAFVDAGSYFMDEAAAVYEQAGLRGVLSVSTMDQPGLPASIAMTCDEAVAAADALYERWNGAAEGRLHVAYALRALMSCSEELIRKTGDLPLRASASLLAGSLIGAVAGTRVGLILPPTVLTVILYLVVLGSGASVLVRMRGDARRPGSAGTDGVRDSRQPSSLVLFAVGLVTAVVCAASGAGGPVLVVPVLMLLGIPARQAVAMALLDSVAVGIPAAIGYFAGGSIGQEVWGLLPAALIAHGAGVLVGAANAHRINAGLLKAIVASGSILIALIKLAQLACG